MDRVTFKSGQGFLVHMVGGTYYKFSKPYLHGLFLSVNVWQDYRDSYCYRLAGGDESSALDELDSLEWDPLEDEEEAIGVASLFGDAIESPFSPQPLLPQKTILQL